MPAGQYIHKLTLQQSTEVQDAGGGYALTWVDVEDIWARIVYSEDSTYNLEGPGVETPTTYYLLESHYRKDLDGYTLEVTPRYRLLWKAKDITMLITAVENVEYRNRTIRIQTRKINGDIS